MGVQLLFTVVDWASKCFIPVGSLEKGSADLLCNKTRSLDISNEQACKSVYNVCQYYLWGSKRTRSFFFYGHIIFFHFVVKNIKARRQCTTLYKGKLHGRGSLSKMIARSENCLLRPHIQNNWPSDRKKEMFSS